MLFKNIAYIYRPFQFLASLILDKIPGNTRTKVLWEVDGFYVHFSQSAV